MLWLQVVVFALGAGSVPEHAHALMAAFERIHAELPAEVRGRLGTGTANAADCRSPSAAASVEAGSGSARWESSSAKEEDPGLRHARAAALLGASCTTGMSPRDAFFAEVEECAPLHARLRLPQRITQSEQPDIRTRRKSSIKTGECR